jgi:hypothetical protein
MIDLLNEISRGKHREVEEICQRFLSLESCLRVLLSPVIQRNSNLFSVYTRFLHAVYFDSAIPIRASTLEDASRDIWRLMGVYLDVCKKFSDANNPSKERALVLDSIAPLLAVFYSKFFKFSQATQEQKNLSEDIVNYLARIAKIGVSKQ